jgi:hypothetical protein
MSETDHDPAAKRVTRPRKKPIIRNVLRGGGIGGGIAILLLIFYAVLVFTRATRSSLDVWGPEHPASLVTQFLFSIVCFGPLFLGFCIFIGAAVGFVKSRL